MPRPAGETERPVEAEEEAEVEELKCAELLVLAELVVRLIIDEDDEPFRASATFCALVFAELAFVSLLLHTTWQELASTVLGTVPQRRRSLPL